MASRESVIQIGLDWLAAGGQLLVSIEEDIISLSAAKQEKKSISASGSIHCVERHTQ